MREVLAEWDGRLSGRKRRLPEEVKRARDQVIARRASDGESFTSIGEDMGLSRQHVSRIARAHGVPSRGQGEHHHAWSGGRSVTAEGYIELRMPDHPRAGPRGYVFEHVIVAEEALGKPVPRGAVVHHVNEKRDDNRPENLVICENPGYHAVLHMRLNALRESGHADWMKCGYCGGYGDPESPDMYYHGPTNRAHHKACKREYEMGGK